MQLANRIGLQLLAPTMPGNARYAIGQQRLDTPPPFDAASDAAALRAIATELWGPT